jgi:AcrR family transcriptional regulator
VARIADLTADVNGAAFEARRQIWREAAITSATQLFAASGYETTSMQAVAKASGLSLRALYQSFPSKHELFVAVLDRAYLDVSAALRVDAAEDPRETVLRSIDGLLQSIDNNREAFLLSMRAQASPAMRDDSGEDLIARFESAALDALTELVARALRNEDLDSRIVAQSIIGAVTANATSAIRDAAEKPVARLGAALRATFAPIFDGPAHD